MTGEPAVVRAVTERMNAMGNESLIRWHAELTRSWLAITQILVEQMQRSNQAIANASGPTNEATNLMQQVAGLMSTNSLSGAVEYLNRADQKLAMARHNMLMSARQTFTNASASPLLTHVSMMPLHWQLSQSLGESRLKANGLAGGEFEQLDQLTANGWQNERSYDSSIETRVELSPSAAYRGKSGLMLTTASTNPAVESAALWINSGSVRVKAGQFLRIHGWVNIPRPITGGLDGLMIYDSVGGKNLGERLITTNGWQEFTMYRGVPEDGDLRITFALAGLGQAMIDEVTVQVLERTTDDRQASEPSLYESGKNKK